TVRRKLDIKTVKDNVGKLQIIDWMFGIAVFAIGVLNVFLVHPVPGVVYLLLSFVYLPPANAVLRKRFGFRVPLVVKIILGIFIIMFTLGVSDLGDMIDDWSPGFM
ncbi:MAG TPA: hypothetical protein VGB00_02930, partial [Pyrinomonadaceae bacterium]